MFESKTSLIFIGKITFFLINIILAGIEFWIYKRTKEKGALTTTKGFILGAVGTLFWIVTDNIWIFAIIELFSGILVYKGMAEESLTERATGISLLERCTQGIPIESIQYKKPIKTKSVIIEVTLDIIISLLLGLFFFYIFDDYGLLLAFLLSSGISGISMMILLRKFKERKKNHD